MVGPAFTLRCIPAREDRNPITVFRNPEHPQRVAVETCPPGHVLVMDGRKDARAGTAGSMVGTVELVNHACEAAEEAFWSFGYTTRESHLLP